MGARSRRLLAAAAAALLPAAAVLLAACGGDEPADSFAADAERICTDSVLEQTELGIEHLSNRYSEIATHMRELREAGERALAELEQLTPPDDSAEQWADYLDNRREALEAVADRGAAAEQEDAQGVTDAGVELADLLSERDAIGADLGLEACARILPPEDEQMVRDVIELGAVSGDGARICEEAVADAFLEQEFGGSTERCTRAQRQTALADAIEYRELSGVAGATATAEVELVGGRANGSRATVELVYEDGAYKIYRLTTESS